MVCDAALAQAVVAEWMAAAAVTTLAVEARAATSLPIEVVKAAGAAAGPVDVSCDTADGAGDTATAHGGPTGELRRKQEHQSQQLPAQQQTQLRSNGPHTLPHALQGPPTSTSPFQAASVVPLEQAASTGSTDVVNCSFAAPAVQQQCPSGAQLGSTSGATRPAAGSPPRAGPSFQFTSASASLPPLTPHSWPAGRLDSSGKWGFNDPRLLQLPEVSLQPQQPVLQSPGGASGTAAGGAPDRALSYNQRWRASVPSGSGRRRRSGSRPAPSAGASRRGAWGSSRGGSGSGGGLREVLVEAPSPELPCPSCIPQLPQEQCDVEVHSIGRFQLKGASGPVDMVEVVLSHLAGRRLLLIDSGLPKGQKGKLLEAAQPGSSLMAAVNDVQLPGLGALYRRQYEQQCAAAAADGTGPHPGPQGQAAKQAATLAAADGRSAVRQGSQRQLSFFGRSSSSVAASAASLGVRMGSWTRASLHSAASSSSSALPAAQPECSSSREAGQ